MTKGLVNREFETTNMKPMMNDKNEIADKYLPRKCSATSKILGPKDHGSVQITIPQIDENGVVIPESNMFTFALSGYIREKGRSDYEIEKLLFAKSVKEYIMFAQILTDRKRHKQIIWNSH